MTATGKLIPAKRLRWIPKELRLAHEYCFFLHDECVRMLVEYEKERAHIISFTFKDKAEGAKRGGLTRSDSFLRFLSGTSEAIMLP
ncbi:hypothetical protein, partial [Burkholderia pseudomallei]|uniref:hypothetical protein n=1 Tax=Burkholderia pseudomallei TaxID=28450 RepID=UPI001C82C3CC